MCWWLICIVLTSIGLSPKMTDTTTYDFVCFCQIILSTWEKEKITNNWKSVIFYLNDTILFISKCVYLLFCKSDIVKIKYVLFDKIWKMTIFIFVHSSVYFKLNQMFICTSGIIYFLEVIRISNSKLFQILTFISKH